MLFVFFNLKTIFFMTVTLMSNTQQISNYSPAQRYALAIDSGQFLPDEAQAQAVQQLQRIWEQLIEFEKNSKGFFARFKKQTYPKGVYMWGGVGRGKTWLMDQFFDSVPLERKKRLHFHHFMKNVHTELNKLSGQQNPLDTVADQICKEALVICFDEFFVSNVTDAMILGDLFQKLFTRGITLVATSNIEPDGLYKHGIHRDRFLPTIALVNQHCEILNVDAGVDYRLRVLKQAQLFKSPLTDEHHQWLSERFNALLGGKVRMEGAIEINNRQIPTIAHSDDILWCDFRELCYKPRSPADFIELANRYNTILVSGVPHLNDVLSDATRRFIYLVDEFYDRGVKLLLTSEDSIIEIYQGERLAFEIERTRSRLLEMQSDDYLNSSHRQIQAQASDNEEI